MLAPLLLPPVLLVRPSLPPPSATSLRSLSPPTLDAGLYVVGSGTLLEVTLTLSDPSVNLVVGPLMVAVRELKTAKWIGKYESHPKSTDYTIIT
jgi:hypothetical protein